MLGGGVTKEIPVVVSVAVQDAPAVAVAATGMHVAMPSVVDRPWLLADDVNVTVPVGPWALLLLEETKAVNVTLWPELMVVVFAAMEVLVAAVVMVSVRAGLVLALKLESPA